MKIKAGSLKRSMTVQPDLSGINEKSQITNITNITNPTDMKSREYFKHLFAKKFNNLDEMEKFFRKHTSKIHSRRNK